MRLASPIYLLLIVFIVSSGHAADPVYQNGGLGVGGFEVISYYRDV